MAEAVALQRSILTSGKFKRLMLKKSGHDLERLLFKGGHD